MEVYTRIWKRRSRQGSVVSGTRKRVQRIGDLGGHFKDRFGVARCGVKGADSLVERRHGPHCMGRGSEPRCMGVRGRQ